MHEEVQKDLEWLDLDPRAGSGQASPIPVLPDHSDPDVVGLLAGLARGIITWQEHYTKWDWRSLVCSVDVFDFLNCEAPHIRLGVGQPQGNKTRGLICEPEFGNRMRTPTKCRLTCMFDDVRNCRRTSMTCMWIVLRMDLPMLDVLLLVS